MVVDHSLMRLGKRPRRLDDRTLQLTGYLEASPALPPPPSKVDYTRGVTDWGMMSNDTLSCCTISSIGHALQVWTLNTLGRELTVPDADIQHYYQKWDGYCPNRPETDQGGVEVDVLDHWRREKFNGQPLDAYVALNLSHPDGLELEVKTAIWRFGGCYIGAELPLTAKSQDVWNVVESPSVSSEPGSWGGHAMYVVGYEEPGSIATPGAVSPGQAGALAPPVDGLLTCITWGQLKKMTWSWFRKYCSEAYALVSKDWIESSGSSPSGFNLAALECDLKSVTAESVPAHAY